MSYVILVRNPQNDRVIAVENDDSVAVFETGEEAEARMLICQAWPYSIVEAP